MRSDIKNYYDSINFDILMALIESYIKDPALLTLISKACRRTETHGGIFYDYHEKGIPMGSPLSPLLGAIALMPLDQAMGKIKDIFYSRFMDDWVVLTKSKTALRKVVKLTHRIVSSQKLHLHPMKTYIGNISHGFNFLAYYFDDKKILPAQETIRRFHERANALYERPLTKTISRRYQKTAAGRDISLYQVNEAAPSDDYFKNFLISLLARASHNPDKVKRLRRYIGQWARWLKLGLSSIEAFAVCVQTLLPSLFSCWSPGACSSAGSLA
jgi:RNA-directed DNA polymerase